MLAKASTKRKAEAQKRFLDTYPESLRIAVAARAAGVHRATVYRWMTDPAFTEAIREATAEFFRRTRVRVDAQEAERYQWRREREKARRPMRCEILAKARAAKRG